MRSLLILVAGAAVFWTAESYATVTFELVSPPELTVEQGSAHSPTEFLPLDGEPLLVWGRLRNDGPDEVALTGPGGIVGSLLNASLWTEFPRDMWDEDSDPDDALITNPLGYSALVLQPGESFEHPFLRVWGVDLASDDPLFRADLGTEMIVQNLRMSFWGGLNQDPNDVFDPPDVYLPLDQSFSVTVVPEPCPLLSLLMGVVLSTRKGRCQQRRPAAGAWPSKSRRASH